MKIGIENRLPDEYKVLYKMSRGKKLDRYLLQALLDKVQHTRNRLRDMSTDKLELKLLNYGNEGKWASDQILKLSRMIYNNKSPDESHLGEWLSVEIECIFANRDKESAFVKFVRSKGWAKFVTIKDDGSIKTKSRDHDCGESYDENGELINCDNCNPNAYGREVIVTFRYNNWDIIKGICSELTRLKCEVNKTCGLHVHFDCRHLTARQVTSLGKKVANTVPALKSILPKSRANNEYCSQVMNSHSQTGNGRYDRYAFVNVQSYAKYKTLEIRGHSGTTDATKIINWIKILKVIMGSKIKMSVVSNTISELLNHFAFDNELSAYIQARYEKFNKIDKNVTDDVANDNNNLSYVIGA